MEKWKEKRKGVSNEGKKEGIKESKRMKSMKENGRK